MKQIIPFLVLFISMTPAFAQNSTTESESADQESWDNFRERQASVFNFTFCVPEGYVSTANMGEAVVSSLTSASFHIDVGKYEVFEILEEELSKEMGAPVVVADPDLEDKKFKSYNPGCDAAAGKKSFGKFPGWMFNKFLKYDTEVPYLVKMEVNIIDRTKAKANQGPHEVNPTCRIKLILFDRDKKKLGTYTHVKKDFGDDMRVSRSENEVYDHLLNSKWKLSSNVGLHISDIIGIYVQTLQEMMAEQEISLP